MEDLFATSGALSSRPLEDSGSAGRIGSPLEIFEARLTGQRSTDWRSLFQGFSRLKAITYSSSLQALIAVADLFEDVEVIFGSERVLGRELETLEKATVIGGYQFLDAIADQKAAIEHLLRPTLQKGGDALLRRVAAGSMRFAILRQAPSHEKLYLLEGDGRRRVIVGSANLSLSAFTGRMRETFICFDDPEAFAAFSTYATRDEEAADPVRSDLLVVDATAGEVGARPTSQSAAQASIEIASLPVSMQEVPAFRSLEAGLTVVEQPRRLIVATPNAQALREAGKLGAELREMTLDRDKKGATLINSKGFLRAWRAVTSRPIVAESDRTHSAVIDIASGLVTLDDVVWHEIGRAVADGDARRDAELLDAYMISFAGFYGDAAGIQRGYWALMAWLYSAPFAPMLRATMTRHDGDTLRYPVIGLVYGQSHGGKSHLSRVLVRSMFGIHKELPGREFTTARALGFRDRMASIPLVVDDLNSRKMTEYLPDLVKSDREFSERYAPILISTNRDVQAVQPELRKRMVVVHIAGSKPKALSAMPAQKALGIGTGLYRDYLNRLAPEIPALLKAAVEDPGSPPDLISVSARCLREALTMALGGTPDWAPEIGFEDIDTMKDRHFVEALSEISERAPDQVSVDHKSGVIAVRFAGDTAAAVRFEKLVPAQVLRGRIADAITLDIVALEHECGYRPSERSRSWLSRLFSR
jgi:hypothetical protein